ncbi:MAG: molybdopterin-dependent oxidoreductase [Chloracidobacterium sp.]|nr:molybdopterin-dependent oxidoreductase [Chloracidobacterium sp.]
MTRITELTLPNGLGSRGMPGVISGAMVGLMLMASLIAFFYLAWILVGLPFVAFDLLDWLARALPGPTIASGIDTMVSVIRALHLGPTAETAKIAEKTIAIAGLLITGAISGAALFTILRAFRGNYASLFGAIIGAVVGALVALISNSAGQTSTAGPIISAAWILGAFLIWGAILGWSYRRLSAERAAATRIDRRRFLVRLGGATTVITVAAAVLDALIAGRRRREIVEGERWSANHALPNAAAEVKPAPGTRQEFTPLEQHYRIDIDTFPPVIKKDDWRLKISGLLETPLLFTLDDLRGKYEPSHQFITLSCVSNPIAGDLIGTTRWTGVSLQRLLPDLKLKPQATHLKIRSADGFFEVVPLETVKADERVMLTYAWDGEPLLAKHGFPLRIYIPDVYGMKQPKWIKSIEATDHWEPGYWVERGWDAQARMKATSVIDTVAANMMISQADARALIPIGGIAHAGARGVSKVEVQVDGGEWREAQLRAPLSGLTWVIWRYDWPFQEGRRTFTVRCYDGAGAPQIVEETPPAPAGASGLHSMKVKF